MHSAPVVPNTPVPIPSLELSVLNEHAVRIDQLTKNVNEILVAVQADHDFIAKLTGVVNRMSALDLSTMNANLNLVLSVLEKSELIAFPPTPPAPYVFPGLGYVLEGGIDPTTTPFPISTPPASPIFPGVGHRLED